MTKETSRFGHSITAVLTAALLSSVATTAHAEMRTSRAERVGMSTQQLARIEPFFKSEYTDQGKLGSVITLVARRGKIVHLGMSGMRDMASADPVAEDDLFRIYSMTKPVTGVAMMILYEEGKFQLSDPLSKYIPEFADLKVFAGVDDKGQMIVEEPKRAPTVHDLMRHTAGFSYGYFGDTPVDKAYREAAILNPGINLKETTKRLSKIPLLYQPGEKWHYSVSVDVQGYLIEVLSGKPFDVFLKERLFDPLGMSDTDFYVEENDHPRLTTLYGRRKGQLVEYKEPRYVAAYLSEPQLKSGGGGLVSTTEDYFKFAQMLVNGGELSETRILGRKTIEFMGQDHLPPTVKGPSWWKGTGFGLDFGVILNAAQQGQIGSDGEMFWGGAASTVFWADPKEELIAILMTQYMSGGEVNFPLSQQLHALVYGALID